MASQEIFTIDAGESSTQKTEISTTSSIKQRIKGLTDNRTLNIGCIYRVPGELRKANEAAYTPRLVSIGPLHNGRDQLQSMEAYKLTILDNFSKRFDVDIDKLVEMGETWERSTREFYLEQVKLNEARLTEMILLDGIFIVDVFLKNHFEKLRESSDTIFQYSWMRKDLLHDMLLLENQLPIQIPVDIFELVDKHKLLTESDDCGTAHQELTFYDLAWEFFKDVGNTGKILLKEEVKCWTWHFVDFLLKLHAPPLGSSYLATSPNAKFEYTRSAAELKHAGVKFSKGEGGCLFTIQFDKDKGELTIPPLTINYSTETFFRNLIAFEQSGLYPEKNIASYVILMDSLINSSRDVDLLVDQDIIKNELGDSKVVADLFNNLYKEVVIQKDFHFSKLCQDLNEYSRDKWHEWKASWFKWKVMLRKDYFSNPWTFISLLAATVLLVLTVIQTVCSIFQLQP